MDEIFMKMNNTISAGAKLVTYDEQYVSEWHEDLQSLCMAGTFMPDYLEGIN